MTKHELINHGMTDFGDVLSTKEIETVAENAMRYARTAKAFQWIGAIAFIAMIYLLFTPYIWMALPAFIASMTFEGLRRGAVASGDQMLADVEDMARQRRNNPKSA